MLAKCQQGKYTTFAECAGRIASVQISFVLPFLNWTGGVRVVFEYAHGLHRRGHHVTIYFPLLPYAFADRPYTFSGFRRWLGDLALNLRRRTHQKWFPLDVPLVMVPRVASPFIGRADAIIATAWPTAYSVSRLPPLAGTKFHLVQHHETWSGPPDAVNGSYRLSMHKIVIASWLSNLIEQASGQTALAVINNGVDLSTFYPDTEVTRQSRQILMQYSHLPWKGVADGLRAWDTVRARCPDSRLVMFGLERGRDVPSDIEFHVDPDQHTLRGLYSSSGIFLSTSWTEGCQLPPMEAMACGCAVVATNVGGVPDYTVPGKTALVVEPHDVEGMAKAIIWLLQNEEERRRLAENGHEQIKQFGWDQAITRFESALLRGIGLHD